MKHSFRSVLAYGATSVPVLCDKMLVPSGERLKATNFVAVFSQPDHRGQAIEGILTHLDKDAN